MTTQSVQHCLSVVFLVVVTGCAKSSPEPAPRNVIRPDFETEFDRLFLSDEPLRYQDNVAFLDAIAVGELHFTEKDIIRTKLKQFLSMKQQDRDYAPDSEHTGVASGIAFLRLKAVQLLAQVGMGDDIEFIRLLLDDLAGEHPLFAEECRLAIDSLEAQ